MIGGAPAAAVVFTGEVDKRTAAEPRGAATRGADRARPTGPSGSRLRRRAGRRCGPPVRAEKISEVAAEFDGIHNIHRAVEVGSVDAVIPAAELRPEIIAAIERDLLEEG